MGLFNRMFTWGKSEAHSAMDKIEDPVKMTEQGIRDMKKDLEIGLKGLAEVKALSIRSTREAEEKKQIASDYEKKAMLLLGKAQKGEMDSSDADRLASEALVKKDGMMKEVLLLSKQKGTHNQAVAKMESSVKRLKSQINTWENELQTLKARAKVATTTKKLNKQLAQTDTSGTIAMLEKMKDRVNEEEALAESYGEIAANSTSIDDEINRALEGSPTTEVSDSLAALKAKMGSKK